DGDVNMQNDLYVSGGISGDSGNFQTLNISDGLIASGGISGDVISGKSGFFSDSLHAPTGYFESIIVSGDAYISGDFYVSGTTYVNEVIDTTISGTLSGYTGIFNMTSGENASFTQSLTISGVPVSTGAGGTVGGLPVVGGDDDNIDFGGTEPGDVRDINFQQGGENIMVIDQDGDVNMQNDLYVSGGISGDIISGKTGVFTESLTVSGFPVLTGVSTDPVFKTLEGQVSLNSASSFVFFSDAINNLGATFKAYNPTPVADIYLSNVVVDFANDMRISIRWDGPPDDYMGTGYIDDIEIPISNITELGNKTRRFEGYLDNLDLAGETLISGSANGRTGYINLFEIGVGVPAEGVSIAAVNTATPAPGSNLGTTDLKNGDTIDIEVVYNANNFFHPLQIPASINVYDQNLARQSTHTNLAWHNSSLGVGFSGVTLPVIVSSRDGDLGVCIDSTNNAGVVAAKQCSTEFAGPNRTRPVDNVAPTISFGAVDYPANQGALKLNEPATVNHTINNADSFSSSSNNGDLTIVIQLYMNLLNQ
ncbi:MAG: hypothetical protein ACKVHB_06495, partial [Pseudomonadales bacterium]